MHGHGHPKLTKKLNDKIPKMLDEMFKRVRAFIRGEAATRSAEMVPPSQGDKGYIRSSWSEGPEKLEIEQIEEVVASAKMAHLVKDILQNNQKNMSQGRNNVKVINMIREGGNRKRPFEEERSGLTDELTFLAILQNQLTDEPIILEGVIEGNQSSAGRFFKRNVSSYENNRSSNNYGKGRKKQNGANGVCDNKISFAIHCHNRKDRNKKPQSERLYRNADTWKGCKVHGRRCSGVDVKRKCPG
uniref:Reverse transcriptase domain-containing protein n=1 Tax=Tanacetum cinerariifolium TaxID=118510 RepID=A0A6L2LYH6_TANCI|nr:hypothetical protein [Tanacetum cinerariifolium]